MAHHSTIEFINKCKITHLNTNNLKEKKREKNIIQKKLPDKYKT